MIGGLGDPILFLSLPRRMYPKELFSVQPGPQQSRVAPVLPQTCGEKSYLLLMLPRFLWFVMHRKLTNTENTEQFGLAGEKDICLQ